MKSKIGLVFVLALSANFPLSQAAEKSDHLMAINAQNAPLKGVLEMIAAKSGRELVLEGEPSVNVTLAQSGATAKELLEKLVSDYEIEYTLTDKQLFVTKRKLGSTVTMGDSHRIHLKFANATEMIGKLNFVLSKDDKLIADEHTNNLIFIGSKKNFDKIENLIALFDEAPKQIMIEAQIVETSHQFLQDIGISMGDTSDRTLTNKSAVTGFTSAPGPSNPNSYFKAILGHIDGRALDLRLTAAETKGEAKVVSRPRVTTQNNRLAKIQSGISYHVKTLTNVTGGTATGGVTSVNAGLSLSILPTLVGTDQVNLVVEINNSQPDEGSAVDGIPGILSNAASTAVTVKNKQTAVIAGLIKQSNSKSSNGVPILSDIPLIGLLFKSHSVAERNNELVIFLTPTIDDHNNVTVEARMPATVDSSTPESNVNGESPTTSSR